MEQNSLKKKTVRGIGWSFADSMFSQGVTFLVGLVLARILSPDEYGLIGIISIFIAIFNSIVDSGFSNAIIRKQNATKEDYNTMFILNLIVSVVSFLLLFLLAPCIAYFFKREELCDLCRVMSVVVIIQALSIVQNTAITKEIDFKKKAKASLISSLCSGVVGICMAFTGFGVWALVGQTISMQFINTICLWMFNRWCPNFSFSVISFREMWNFGWKLLVSRLLDTFWNEIYQVVIGKFYSAATLGLYTRSQQFGNIFSSNLTNVVKRVSFPVLSTLQDDKVILKNGYKKAIKLTMFVTFTLMLGMVGCAKPLIIVLIGEKWIDCVPFLQLVCLNMMLYPLHALNLNMLQVQGRSDLFLRLEIIKKIVAIGPIIIGIFFNIYWMLIGSIFVGLYSYYLNAYYSGSYLNYPIKEQILDILPSFVNASIMMGIIIVIGFIPLPFIVLLFLQILIGAVFMIIINEAVQNEEYRETKRIIISVLRINNKQ